jgi:hypothetical protein
MRCRITAVSAPLESDVIVIRRYMNASRDDAKRGNQTLITSMLHRIPSIAAFLLMHFVFCTVATSKAADNKGTKCKIQFGLHGWSAFYETASGTGSLICDNGQTSRVKIEVRGGGLTAGKSSLKRTGTFSEVADINEVFGAYAKAEAHAGVMKSA